MKIYRALGTMSGTSADGIDLAILESDGKKLLKTDSTDWTFYAPYHKEFKDRLHQLCKSTSSGTLVTLKEIKQIENELTLLHAEAIHQFLAKLALPASEIDLIGFHGHTVLHQPGEGITWQIGNSHLLAAKTGINVVADFRSKDVALGGQGAPLVPIFHFYLLKDLFKKGEPVALLNIGGIANLTYFKIGSRFDQVKAFDIGFGNAISDDLTKAQLGIDFDDEGKIAGSGKVVDELASSILSNEIFVRKPPKSFDREDFKFVKDLLLDSKLELPNMLATLGYVQAKVVELNFELLPVKPKKLLICGGGRKNFAILNQLKQVLTKVEVKTAEEIGIDGGSIEAMAFAFLAIRSANNLPITFRNTTGVSLENNYAPASNPKLLSSCGAFYRA